jgi:flagellar biosynthesis/type III secretory pathway protein FliH
MNIDKITKKIKKFGEESYEEGYSNGFDAGFDAGYANGESDNDTLKEYRDMLSFRMSLAFDGAMKDNKMTNAKIYKEIIEYLELDLIDDPYNSIEVK